MIRRFWNIITGEWKTALRDDGVFLVLVGALVIYSALYGFVYEPEVVRDMPIAVVDCDMSEASGELSRRVDATPAADVVYTVPTLEEAKELFMDHKVVGVLLIDRHYQENTLSGRQAHVSVYADGSYFLLYSGFLNAVADVVVASGAQIETHNLVASGIDEHRAQTISQAVHYKIERLYNPYNGYATALLPAVLIVILQQVLLIGIGMGMGTDNEFRRWGRFNGSSALTITMGKALAYFLLYLPLCFYLFWADYKFFGYPINGSQLDVILFLL
ncbi:MAG: ABC transporter permease, partial [Mucinivorans sp.]